MESFKSKVTIIKSKINRAYADIKVIHQEATAAKNDATKVLSFKGMYSNLSRVFDKIENYWDELHAIHITESDAPKFPSDEENKILVSAKRMFYEVNSIYISIQERDHKESSTCSSKGATVEKSNLNESSFPWSSSSLPRLDLPKFDGQILNWPRFKDAYLSIIHTDDSISVIRKFHYLVANVSGPAHAIVTKVPLTAENYEIAWKALLETYNKRRLLASAYLNELLNFKPMQGNRSSVASLQLFLSKVCENISAFDQLGIPDKAGFILFHLAIKCVDSQTRESFELKCNDDFPSFEDLTTFVRSRCLALQLSDLNHGDTSHLSIKSSSNSRNHFNDRSLTKASGVRSKASLLTNDNTRSNGRPDRNVIPAPESKVLLVCVVCKSNHGLLSCPTFKAATPTERREFLKSWSGCWNCLSYTHDVNSCKSKFHCRLCKVRHNTDLHIPSSINISPSSVNTQARVNLNSTATSESPVLLGTVMVHIEDAEGNPHLIRMVIDNGSQNSFLTRQCVQRLGLVIRKIPKRITCLGDSLFNGIKGIVSCAITPRSSQEPKFLTDALVVSKITSDLPNFHFPRESWIPYCTYKLADPKFWESRPVDGLLGCDIVPEIWTEGIISLNNGGPRLFASVFGHVVLGKMHGDVDNKQSSTVLHCAQQPDLRSELRRFWELEEISASSKIQSIEDDLVERHFVDTHYRTESGRYVVSLPFKTPDPDLGPSYRPALRRLLNLEDKLRKNPKLSELYSSFMSEYEELGHMSLTYSPSKYVIPHHSVSKIDRSQLKIRVVFDGNSQATSSHKSLNEHLYTGPKLQTELRDVLLSFRTYPVVFVADVVKMYRNILVHPSHRPYQHILWRPNFSDKVEKYELQTLTYGLNCSPFLALRVMAQLKLDHGHEFPLAARMLCRDMYIDDFPTGAMSTESALELQKQLIGLLAKGGFSLSKWASNRVELLDAVSNGPSNSPVSLCDQEPASIKVLGLQWDPIKDCFSYKIDVPDIVNTKRSIASNVAKIFDPLGFLAPVVVYAKSLLQCLWKDQLGWDEPIPDSIKTKWSNFVHELHYLTQIEIPRFIHTENPFEYQVVGFCDASELAYSASIYIRVLSENQAHTHLIMGKTKLAPIKTLSIPRLELCGAHLLMQLFASLHTFLNRIPVQSSLPPTFFTDSTIVLGWINTPSYKLKTFVANRVSEITEKIPSSSWRHVRSADNPSDCSSRGLSPSEITNHTLWWNGPCWLSQPIATWPSHSYDPLYDLPEMKMQADAPALVSTSPVDKLEWMSRFSSFRRLLYFASSILRFIRNRNFRQTGPPTVEELADAETSIIRAVQHEYFFERKDPNIAKVMEKFAKLSPFIDHSGLLRVGGRLSRSDLEPHQKFPILLPANAHFTIALVDHIHNLYFHPGPNLLQALVQLKYWVPSLRKLIKRRIFSCLTCFKAKAKSIENTPKMGDLPPCRVTVGRSFQSTGVDFMGPLSMRDSLKRKATTTKVWVSVFVCMRTKALHLEAVTSLSTDAFLSCLTRFIARRGLPEEMFSDCGTNFRGADRSLQELLRWYNKDANQTIISQFCTVRGIKWNFNPPHAPHFGGIWEAGVKSVKTHLRAVAGMATLTFEELSTLLAQIEAILNSRPLCPLSASPEEVDYLSPAHFLIGGPLLAHPEPTLLDVGQNRLSRWQVVKQMSEAVWKRWRREYLSTLQERTKWAKNRRNLQVGDLVMLRNNDVPPLSWPTARVTDVHPGPDGIIRVATVKTSSSVLQRPVSALVPLLPLMDDSGDVSQ